VYSISPYIGRGGWTWYTGSASWMYRLGMEMLLGLQRTGDHLEIKPHIPKDWAEYQLNYRFGKTIYHIRVARQPEHTQGLTLDGQVLTEGIIPLADDGQTHEVVVVLIEK
jgi:cellobiose phosphorylase